MPEVWNGLVLSFRKKRVAFFVCVSCFKMTAVVASTPLQVFTKSRSPCHMSRDWYVRAGPAYKRNAKFECVFGVQFCEFRAADLCGHFRINELFERGQTFF